MEHDQARSGRPVSLHAHVAANSVLRALLSPLIYVHYREGLPTRLTVGTPPDEPHGAFPGPDPDRIIVLGGISGAAVGVGSFKQGVASVCAGALSRKSGRGTEWSSVAVPIVRAGISTKYLADLPDLHRFDAIVFFPGVSGALSLTSPRRWARDLEHTIAHLGAVSASDATLLVADVPDVSRRVRAPRFVRSMVRQHTTVLNAYTERVVAAHPEVRLIRMPSIDRRMLVDDLFSYTRLYRIWGVHLAVRLATLRGYAMPEDEDRLADEAALTDEDRLADEIAAGERG